MNQQYIIGGILVVLILATGLGAAFYAGVGPAPGGADSGDPITEFPTETPSDQESGDSDTAEESGDSDTADTPLFSFTIENIEECGQTCRDVTATVTNNQNETATGVTVFTRVFAGENNTDKADLVWEGKEEVGTLEAGASHTTTEHVELTLQEARKIDQQDGWITILTTVQTDERTVTFQNSEQVA